MWSDLFASPTVLAGGAIAGLLFGFLLQKGGVTRYSTILGQFLLTDFTVLKVMLSAIVVGGAGIHGMRWFGADFPMHVKSATLIGNAVGGVIFGAGMALLGYCPGTGVGALADGSRHALPGLLGMLVGGAAYAEAFPWLQPKLLAPADLGRETLPNATGLSPFWILALLAIALLALGFVRRRPPVASEPTGNVA
jgi:uncharacterized membrane protein YedE/YeeE